MPRLPQPYVIAEIAGNHGGSLDLAFKMIEAAASCGVDAVKFQKRDIEAMPDEVKERPRSDEHAFGPTEYEHRKALEFTVEEHARLQNKCRSVGVTYSCSAWDAKSYEQLVCDLGVHWVKVPSARNTEWLNWHLRSSVPMHVSFGMISAEERDQILRRRVGLLPEVVPYACTSKYPCSPEETYLLEIDYLKGRAGVVGFSGHHNGIALDVAAYVMGAEYIERHFTLDRTLKGTDQAASLEPQGMTKLVRDLNAVRAAYNYKPGGVPSCEEACRKKLKWKPK